MFPHRTRISFGAFLAISTTFALLGLLLLLLPAQTSQAQSQPEALGSVGGVVRNTQGDPLPNITVYLQHYLFQGENRQVTSNNEGVYVFPSLPSGTYNLRFEDNNKQYATKYYVDADFTIDATNVVVNGNDVGNVDMELTEGGSISLTLWSASPVTTTSYYPTLYLRTVSGAWRLYRQVYGEMGQNQIELDGLPAGTYRLCVNNNNYYYGGSGGIECYDNVIPVDPYQLDDHATDIQVQAGKETKITIDFEDSPQIEGTILSTSNQPLEGIPVFLVQENLYQQYWAMTNEHGYFRFPPLQTGIYNLVFNPPNYAQNSYQAVFYPNGDTPATLTPIYLDRTTHISDTTKLRAAARITGKVTLPGDVPLNWAEMSIFRQWSDGTWNTYQQCISYLCFSLSTYDSNTGVYTVTNLIPGNYRLGANTYLNSTQFGQFTFYGGDTLEEAQVIPIKRGETKSNVNIVVGEGKFDGVISGQITADGQPLPGIEVGLFPPYGFYDIRSAMPNFTTLTDAQGRYALEGLSMGNYIIGARDPQGMYATTFYHDTPFVDYIPPIPGENLWYSGTGSLENIDIALSPGATVRGHIRTQNKMHGDYIVQLVRGFNGYPDPYGYVPIPYADEMSDANGFYEISGVSAGTYYLRAIEPSSSGDFRNGWLIFYPGTYDGYLSPSLTITTGQTLEGMDFYIFDTPTLFLPTIEGEGETPASGMTPAPIPISEEPRPIPTATPMFP